MFSDKNVFLVGFLVTVSHHVVGKKYFAGSTFGLSENERNSPPAPTEVALMARYVVHNSDWVSIGTISFSPSIKGYPFIGLKSMSDGPISNGTGIPYMLMTDMDISMRDLNHDNRCTLFVTLAEQDYCKIKNYDPQDPRCARIMLTGSIEKLQKDSPEEIFAKNALYSRHPAMSWWPIDHNFFIAKLNIIQIGVLDFFGGIKYVTPEAYFAANNDYDYESKIVNKLNEEIDGDIQVIQIDF